MNTMLRFLVLSLAIVVTASCDSRSAGGSDTDTAAGDAAANADSVSRMPGMQGMGDSMPSTAMVEAMRTHLDRLERLPGQQMTSAIPQHRQMLASLIAQMNTEMRAMGMTADAAWTATVDSLRTDLVRLPDMSAQELPLFMPGHSGRLKRLMELHGRMMRSM